MHQTEYINAKVNQEILPLLVIYSNDFSEVLLQISDLLTFFDGENISETHLEALLLKSKIIDQSKDASKMAETLPLISENIEINNNELNDDQKEIDVYHGRDEGLDEFQSKPLVDQFNELFKITEDPLAKIIKNMDSKGDDKYATFNPEDIEFHDDAFDQTI